MSSIQILWGIIGAQWALMLIIAGYLFKKFQELEQKLASQDKEKSIKLTAIEMQLAGINATLLELKKELRDYGKHIG